MLKVLQGNVKKWIKQHLPSSAYNLVNIHSAGNFVAKTAYPVLNYTFRGFTWLTSSDLKACLVCVYFKNLEKKKLNYLLDIRADWDLVTLVLYIWGLYI